MAISEDDRLALRTKLTETLGERETRVLMESVPPVDYDQLATKTDLEHQSAQLSAQIAQLRTEMDAESKSVATEFRSVRAEMNAEFKSVRAEFDTARAEIRSESASLRDEFAQLRLEMATGQRRMMVTHIGSMIGLAAFIAVA